MKSYLKLFVSLLLIFLITGTLAADNETTDVVVNTEFQVKPGKFREFETATKNMVQKLKQVNHPTPVITFRGDDFLYISSVPIKKIGDIGEMDKNWMSSAKKMGKLAYNKMMNSFSGTYDYRTGTIWMRDKQLSYTPKNAGSRMHGNYFYWEFYYINPEHENEAFRLLGEYKKLYSESGITLPYDVSIGVFGAQSPVILFSMNAKNMNDLMKKEKEGWKKMTGEQKKKRSRLQQKLFSMTRKFKKSEAWFVPELSYFPGK